MSLFKKSFAPLLSDLHSHLIPMIDDGSDSLEMSVSMLLALKELGFKKIITTPHIHPKYPNTPDLIIKGLDSVRKALDEHNVEIELEAAAEYFVDETFMNRLDGEEQLLWFGDRYLLVECSFITKPLFFETAVLKLRSQGYNPIFAHPERYQFLQGDISWLRSIRNAGVLFQVTLGSLSGYYGKSARQLGNVLLKNGMIDFLASDLHKPSQLGFLEKGLKLRSVQKLIRDGSVLNGSLL